MQVIHRNLVTENQHSILIQASNILPDWGFNKFNKYSYAPLNEYMCMLNPSGYTFVYKKDVDEENKQIWELSFLFKQDVDVNIQNATKFNSFMKFRSMEN